MKNIGLFFALLLLLWSNNTSLFAQDAGIINENEIAKRIGQGVKNALKFKNPSFSFGVKAGLNYSYVPFSASNNGEILDTNGNVVTYDPSDHAGFKPRFGFMTGFYVQQRISKLVGFQAELLYSQKGATQAYKDEQGNWQPIRLHYVSVPLLLDVSPFKNVHLQAGTEVSYAAAYRPTFDVFRRWGRGDLVTHKLDVGIIGGVSYRVKKMEFGVRYVYGLLPYYENGIFQTKNNLLQASVAWQLFKK